MRRAHSESGLARLYERYAAMDSGFGLDHSDFSQHRPAAVSRNTTARMLPASLRRDRSREAVAAAATGLFDLAAKGSGSLLARQWVEAPLVARDSSSSMSQLLRRCGGALAVTTRRASAVTAEAAIAAAAATTAGSTGSLSNMITTSNSSSSLENSASFKELWQALERSAQASSGRLDSWRLTRSGSPTASDIFAAVPPSLGELDDRAAAAAAAAAAVEAEVTSHQGRNSGPQDARRSTGPSLSLFDATDAFGNLSQQLLSDSDCAVFADEVSGPAALDLAGAPLAMPAFDTEQLDSTAMLTPQQLSAATTPLAATTAADSPASTVSPRVNWTVGDNELEDDFEAFGDLPSTPVAGLASSAASAGLLPRTSSAASTSSWRLTDFEALWSAPAKSMDSQLPQGAANLAASPSSISLAGSLPTMDLDLLLDNSPAAAVAASSNKNGSSGRLPANSSFSADDALMLDTMPLLLPSAAEAAQQAAAQLQAEAAQGSPRQRAAAAAAVMPTPVAEPLTRAKTAAHTRARARASERWRSAELRRNEAPSPAFSVVSSTYTSRTADSEDMHMAKRAHQGRETKRQREVREREIEQRRVELQQNIATAQSVIDEVQRLLYMVWRNGRLPLNSE